jgi:hypothetical protein
MGGRGTHATRWLIGGLVLFGLTSVSVIEWTFGCHPSLWVRTIEEALLQPNGSISGRQLTGVP